MPNDLWLPPRFNIRRYNRIVRTVTLPDGTRAKVVIDDSHTTKQIETAEQLHAVVAPRLIRTR